MKKKLIILATAFAGLLAGTTQACGRQNSNPNATSDYKPQNGRFSLEVALSPVVINNYQYNGYPQYWYSDIAYPIPEDETTLSSNTSLKLIYTISPHWSARLGLGFGLSSSKHDHTYTYFDSYYGNTINTEKIKTTQNEYAVLPGIVYSFSGTPRLSPYVGAEFSYSYTFCTRENTSKYNQTPSTITKNSNAYSAYGFGLFSGFNYYFAKHLYFGTEIGININFTDTSTTEKYGNNNQSTTTTTDQALDVVFNIAPGIRLGWTF